MIVVGEHLGTIDADVVLANEPHDDGGDSAGRGAVDCNLNGSSNQGDVEQPKNRLGPGFLDEQERKWCEEAQKQTSGNEKISFPWSIQLTRK